ncbi:hypothetical protein [uncultured Methylobacterium sp.]|uniref:hypothetical protein n=1 Tax=uncultured Methylobacterium sp. TaxID=157278 RepID=UPI0035CC844A
MPGPSHEPEADDGLYDPFADLLFALVAAVLPAILVLLPVVHQAARSPGAQRPTDAVTVRGRPAQPILAGADGLRLAEDGRAVPLDRIPDDPALRALLLRLREAGEPLLLIVEPNGLESAFAFEPIAAAYGPPQIEQVRARSTCAAAQEPALARACMAFATAP